MKNNLISDEMESINQSIAYHVKQQAFFENLKVKCQTKLDALQNETGRIMSLNDLFADVDVRQCWEAGILISISGNYYCTKEVLQKIKMGVLFYDKESCDEYIKSLVVEQELRIDDWKKALEIAYK